MNFKFLSLSAALIACSLAAPLGANAGEAASVVLMPAEPASYSVADAIAFYDDGGPDGKYSEHFEGSVTFRPSTPGKKVMVDFTKLALFYNPSAVSVGNQDLLQVYAGTEVKPSALLETLSTEPLKVKSTSVDGALTIYFKSKTAYPTDGWEATVSEFTPQAMTLTAVTASMPESATIPASATGNEMLRFNLFTANTEPALVVNAMTFSTEGTSAPLTGATLYSLGKTADGSRREIGSVAKVEGGSFTVTLSQPMALMERDNWFAATVDVAASAQNDQTVDLALTAINCEGTITPVTTANPGGNRKIFNEWLSRQGQNEVTVLGSWAFKNSPHPTNSYLGYDGAAGDQVVTFIPATPGKVIQLSFDKFDINYGSSYTEKTQFKIYSGRQASGTPIFTVSSSEEAKTIPDGFIRSTAADGTLTVLFNPKGNNGASGKGWNATVSEYQSKPMAIDKAEASQASTKFVAPGTTDAELLRIQVDASGDKNPLSLNSLTLDLKGCESQLSAVKLYSTARSADFATTSLVATAQPAAQVTLTPSATANILEGTQYYWVAVDMAPQINAGQLIDAKLTELRIGNSAASLTSPDPDGAREAKNIYLWNPEDETVTVSSPMIFFDDGGPDAKYTKQAAGTVRFLPAKPGDLVRFKINRFKTYNSDYFTIYNGNSTATANRALSISGQSFNPDSQAPVVSTADDGSLTVKFEVASYSYPNDGWEIEVDAFTPQPLCVDAVTGSEPARAKALRGSEDVAVLATSVAIGGDKGALSLSSISYSIAGTSASTVGKWHLAEAPDAEPLLEGNSLKFNLSGMDFKLPAVKTLTLMADILPSAQIGAEVKVALTFVGYDADKTATPAEPLTSSFSIESGLHGEFRIGSSAEADYSTIKAAIDGAAQGVDGPVTFLIEDGEYSGAVTFTTLPGASSVNTVAFRSLSGNPAKVVIFDNSYDKQSLTEEPDHHGVVTFDGARFVTLRGVTVSTTDETYNSVVRLKNAATDIIIDDCVLTRPVLTADNGQNVIISYNASGAGVVNNDRLTLTNSTLTGGKYGYSGGNSWVGVEGASREEGLRIERCSFINQRKMAINLSGHTNASVSRNLIASTQAPAKDFRGIDCYYVTGANAITANSIRVVGAANPAGLYLRYCTGSADGGHTLIANNEVLLEGVSSNAAGAFLNYPCPYISIAYNTFLIKGSATASRGMYINDSMEGGSILNNIIQNEAGGHAIAIWKNSYKFGKIASNAYFTTSETALNKWGVEYPGLEAWNAATADAGSVVEKTAFLDAEILEPAAEGSLLAATPLAEVATDINGNPRSATAPTIGAYEYGAGGSDIAPLEGYPVMVSVADVDAIVAIAASLNGRATVAVTPAGEPEPAEYPGEIVTLRANRVVDVPLANLEPNTRYTAWVKLSSLRGAAPAETPKVEFKTSYPRTQVSEFEDVTPAPEDGSFVDGTARFEGFVQVDIAGRGQGNTHGVQVAPGQIGIVTTVNAPDIPLDGFFIQNAAAVTVTTKTEDGAVVATKVIDPNGADWRYVDLSDMSPATTVEISSPEAVTIDNFSGAPDPLKLAVADVDGTLKATVSGGVLPFNFLWENFAGEPLEGSFSATPSADYTRDYMLTLTDGRNQTAKAYVRHSVAAQAPVMATFQDNLLAEPDSWWNGADRVASPDGSFVSGTWRFTNLYNAAWGSWEGWAYTNSTSTEYTGNYATQQYNNVVGSGYESTQYAVAFTNTYTSECAIYPTNAESAPVAGMWITNTAWVNDAIENGDGMSPPFAKGDYLLLTIGATDADGARHEVQTYLADYRDENAANRWKLDSWQWVDLSALGQAKRIDLSIATTKMNQYGATTPLYVAVDNFGAECPVVTASELTVYDNERTVSLLPYVASLDADRPIEFTLLEGAGVALDGAEMTVLSEVGSEATLSFKAFQLGHSLWFDLPIKVVKAEDGIDAVNHDDATVAARYDTLGRLVVGIPAPGTVIIEVLTDGTVRRTITR